jgi:predicted permease
MQTLIADIRYALRQLRKAPGFTLTAVLILALGIGANAAIFTLVHAVLLRNLPVADPKTLFRVGDRSECCVEGGTQDGDDYVIFAYDLYRHIQANTPEFEQLAAVQSAAWNQTVRGSRPGALAKSLHSEFVSGNYFQTFGLQPYAGRLLTPADDQPNAPPVAVLTYQAWQRDYGLDRSIIGSTFFFNTHPVTIVGVTPPGYYGDRMSDAPPNFFVPFSVEPLIAQVSLLHSKGANWVYLIGRVKPGTAPGPLAAKISGNLRQWLGANVEMYQQASFAKNLANAHVKLTPGGGGIANMQDDYASGLHLLMGISVLVLLIACANMANLVLVRGMARAAETSVRMALGAQRSRIIRQLLTESLVLSTLGGLAGLAVAYAGTRALLAMAFPNSPDLPIHATPSPIVLAFAIGLSLLTGLLFGVAPAWITSHAQPAEALRGANRSSKSNKGAVLQRSLVVLQAALSVVLLIGAGLLSKSLNNLEHQDFGLTTPNRYVIHMSPESAGYKAAQLQALYTQIIDSFHAVPGVEHVSLSTYSPLEGDNWGEGVSIEGRPEGGPNDDFGASWLRASPEFFDLIGQHVLRGRGITAQDTSTSPGIAVVNQTFVKKFFKHGEDPIGIRFGTAGVKSSHDFQIVGVVNDVKYNNPRSPARPMYFRPLLQASVTDPDSDARSLFTGAIMLETRGPIDGLEARSRQVLASINPNLPVTDFRAFDEQIAGQFTQDRLIARLTMLFGALALVLASVGLYGVTAYTVARRTSEIGIRMALGAGRGSVVAMVLRGALIQAGLGLAIGIPVALVSTRLLKSQLYGMTGADPAVLAGSFLVLTLSACLAGLIPARKAASINPMQALRAE